MKWITSKRLQSEFGLSWAEAEQIIREQVRMSDRRWDWCALLIGTLRLTGLLWVFVGAKSAFPSAHGGRLALLELPGLAVLAFAHLVLPRLLAGGAILGVAKARGVACGESCPAASKHFSS
ncbi:hypothetical protein B0E46_12520 [Rhodanobacter sp. B04]|uniref:hypothetical protein n=1 Tax=Rhodanobacter sp. B04 TaxID=1945860 RepID=UPI0009871C15|nr:hypothetical protein [Rhodanobacter sp. B04]OOG62464.1 hypothetical protein B0E46_12520 [Rhodanobacter sp. B04]